MRKIVIIACGNSQRQDDGLAHEALHQLAGTALPGDFEFIHAHQLFPEHASVACQADLLIFLDAAQTGTPGEIRIRKVEPGGSFPGPSHHLSPESLLTFIQQVYGAEPESYLATLCGESFGLGEGLTAATEHALPEMVSQVVNLIVRETSLAS
jgi:hydrogenase maturation protease